MSQSVVNTHRDLRVWQESLVLAEMIYRVTGNFPATEQYGLSSQMRRVAVSIISNIGEGAARFSSRDFAKFLSIARGSLAELESQSILAKRLGFLHNSFELEQRISRIGRMLTALYAAIKRRDVEPI
jgi:four helix bundle protein